MSCTLFIPVLTLEMGLVNEPAFILMQYTHIEYDWQMWFREESKLNFQLGQNKNNERVDM